MVGDYIGAQMAGFDAEAPLGLVDNLQDGEPAVAYTPRTVVVGGNSPFTITHRGQPAAGSCDYRSGAWTGVLSGTPTTAAASASPSTATDADGTTVSKAYTMKVAGGASSRNTSLRSASPAAARAP